MIELEHSTDVATLDDDLIRHGGTLFGTADPRVALERMADVATALVDVIKSQKLYVQIRGHDHITAEGWTTLGGMLGIVPIVVWTKPNETNDGYLARVEARTLDGRIVGAAESECSRVEQRWKTAEPYAIRSMAQTRAIGRALRAPLGQIVVLAGYEPVGAEEIASAIVEEQAAAEAPLPEQVRPTPDQLSRIGDLFRELAAAHPDTNWGQSAREFVGVPGNQMTAMMADRLIEWLQGMTQDDPLADE